MKITDRLVGDHLTFRRWVDELNAVADKPADQRDSARFVRVVELLKDQLLLHAWVEDTFYYPIVRAAVETAPAPPLTRAYMDHLDEEHRTVDGYADRLEQEVKAKPPVGTWPQTFALFSKGLRAHMKKEEEELFPISEKILGADRLEALSRELEAHRSEAPLSRLHTSGH